MTTDTEQWIYKLGAVVIGVCLLGCFGAMIVSIFYFGDGEGLRILDGLTDPILGILASVGALLAPRSIAAGWVAVKSAAAGSVVPVQVPALAGAPAPSANAAGMSQSAGAGAVPGDVTDAPAESAASAGGA